MCVALKKIVERNFKNLLTNFQNCGIIKMLPRGKQKIDRPKEGRKKRYTMNTTANILTAINAQFTDAVIVRRGNVNFLAIPMGENEDGVMTYAKVAVSALLSKDTKTATAFDVDAAQAEYTEWVAKQTEKASKPKKVKETDPAKEAAKQARLNALLCWVKNDSAGEFTSNEAYTALSSIYEGMQIMQVGTDLNTLAKMDENLTYEKREGKKYWSYTE